MYNLSSQKDRQEHIKTICKLIVNGDMIIANEMLECYVAYWRGDERRK